MNRRLLNLLLLFPAIVLGNQNTPLSAKEGAVCPMVKTEVVRLPDLNIPRCGHSFYYVNGQPTVIGGHTSGFVLTPTIEYFSEGQWHVVQTVYPHDSGGSLLMKSGKILLFGSHEKNLGIGQTYEVEMYNPTDHSTEGFGCLDTKRVMASAIETDDGKVIIVGNWYHDDAIEMFDGESQFSKIKNVALQRVHPYMLPISNGDVLIFGSHDTHGNIITSPLVDRLYGEAFNVPLFEEWCPLPLDITSPLATDCVVGNPEDKTYLIPVLGRNKKQVAIAQVCDTIFSLIRTEVPVPMVSQWDSISYRTPIVVNRQVRRAFMAGFDKKQHLCILSIEYDKSPCPLTLYYTDPLPQMGLNHFVLTPQGNLLIAGGTNGVDNNNFSPSNQVWLIPFGDSQEFCSASAFSFPWLLLALVIIFLLVTLTLLLWWRHHHNNQLEMEESEPAAEKDDAHLWQRICQLMEEEKPYLDSNFRVTDAARQLGVNRSRLSACINAQAGCTFNQYINRYRVEYAKELMFNKPDIKMTTICTEVGFNNETSFFRAFKAQTGKTPREWRGSL
ncbi:MAG: helix-turn-helix domain-containing protein [Bacteroidaceae bacterium]|nr:helix-turn-helix domain-containing protein [Bacteroidaceae bacterium]